jgi:phage terminase small subunit
MADKLSIKEEKFCAEYVVDENGTRAAIAAGYAPNSAAVAASRLLKKANIQAQIAKLRDKSLAKLEISRERVLAEIAKIAFLDPRKFFNSDGSVKQPGEIDDDTAASLAGLEVCELFEGAGEQKHAYGLLKKIRIADKRSALELLGKHLKLFTDKVELSGKDGGPIETQSVPVDLASLTDEELKELAQMVAKSRVNKSGDN